LHKSQRSTTHKTLQKPKALQMKNKNLEAKSKKIHKINFANLQTLEEPYKL